MLCVVSFDGHAAKGSNISYIRDEETEQYLKDLAKPIFRAAQLSPDNVKIFIVNNPELNAFVSGGQNIFIHTGLILNSDDPAQLSGVIAHETGHITGGHLIRKMEELEDASVQSTITTLLGLASMAAGAPGAGQAVVAGGAQFAQRNLLQYSRAHEEAADQAAIEILKKINVSPKGLLELLETFFQKQTLEVGEVNPYTLTHPLSRERMSHIESFIAKHPEMDVPTDPALKQRHIRIVAKLKAFLSPKDKALTLFPANDTSLVVQYGRAIALYRQPNLREAIVLMNNLLEKSPDDAYFHELKGQMLFENGKLIEARKAYAKAVELKPEAAQIRMGLANTELALGESFIPSARQNLEQVVVLEPRNAVAWRQLGIAYGRENKLGLSYLALMEEALLKRDREQAEQYLKLAKEHMPNGAPAKLRLEDLKKALNALDKKKS